MMRNRQKAVAAFLVATILVAVPLATATAGTRSTTARKKLFGFVNDYRARHGLVRLRNDQELSTYAWNHSLAMARQKRLFHSTNVTSKIDGRVRTWGENIGYGPGVWRIFREFVKSSAHRANLLGAKFRHGGFGVVRTRGAVWVTMIFYG
jgi:uncharacterized protein YkwD